MSKERDDFIRLLKALRTDTQKWNNPEYSIVEYTKGKLDLIDTLLNYLGANDKIDE